MEKQYSFLELYTTYLIQKGRLNSDIGIWDGKMEIAIYLLHLSRMTNNKKEKYKNYAFQFIEQIFEQVSIQTSFSYSSGLLGIGCGVEYIIGNDFMEGSGDEILSDIDKLALYHINTRKFNNLSLANGICGMGFYFYMRLKKDKLKNDSIISLKNKEVIIYIVDWIEELLIKTNNIEELGDTYFLLCRLYQLNIINFKVDKILSICLQKIIDLKFTPKDNYQLLGIKSLKILKEWI